MIELPLWSPASRSGALQHEHRLVQELVRGLLLIRRQHGRHGALETLQQGE